MARKDYLQSIVAKHSARMDKAAQANMAPMDSHAWSDGGNGLCADCGMETSGDCARMQGVVQGFHQWLAQFGNEPAVGPNSIEN